MKPARIFALSIALALAAVMASPQRSTAQMTGGGFIQKTHSAGGGYTGPGDIVAGWAFWGGLRSFSGATVGTKAANVCNSGDANCADVNTLANGNFDVTTAQGAPLNCGGTGGTCTVKTLKSGNARNLTQATAASRPTLTFSAIGSLPCMTFSAGTGNALMQSTTLSATSPPFTYSIVVKITANDASSPNIFGDVGAGGLARQDDLANTASNTVVLNDNNAAGFSATASASTFHAINAVSNGVSSSIVVDSTTTTGTNGSTGWLNADILAIGDPNFGNRDLAGLVCEAGVTATAMSSGTITSLNSNQHTYWGF